MATKKHIFEPSEKKYFLSILKKHCHIIESKALDGDSLRVKTEAWNSITREFNANPLVNQVTCKQLRRLWMNLKQRRKLMLRKKRQIQLPIDNELSNRDVTSDLDILEVSSDLSLELIGGDDDSSEMAIKIDNVAVQTPCSSSDSTSQSLSNSGIFVIPEKTQSPYPPNVTAFPFNQSTPLPSKSSTPFSPCLCHNKSTIEKECSENQKSGDGLHELNVELMSHQIRDAKAKADLAELKLQQQLTADFRDSRSLAEDMHELEMELMKHRIREAKAKADQAELKLRQEFSVDASLRQDHKYTNSF